MHRFRWFGLLIVVFAIGCVILPGCTNPGGGEKKKEKAKHDHPSAGPHGGPFAEWEKGEDEYHVEFIVDQPNKQVILYLLDDKAKNSPTKVDPKKVTKMRVTITHPAPQFSVDVTYDAKKSEENKGYAFVGTHDRFAEKAEFKGVISGTIGEDKFDGDFPNKEYKK